MMFAMNPFLLLDVALLNAMANGFFSYGGAGNVSIYTGLNVHVPAPGTPRRWPCGHRNECSGEDSPARE